MPWLCWCWCTQVDIFVGVSVRLHEVLCSCRWDAKVYLVFVMHVIFDSVLFSGQGYGTAVGRDFTARSRHLFVNLCTTFVLHSWPEVGTPLYTLPLLTTLQSGLLSFENISQNQEALHTRLVL